MERILRLMADQHASDLYFSANSPVLMRINGQCGPINSQVLPPDAPRHLLAEVLTPALIAELERTGELNVAMPIEGVGNFRISAMRQRGHYAVVVRYICSVIPSLNDLHLPEILKTLVMEKRGLILVVGATGAGKSSTLASMLDYRNEHASGHILTVEDPIEFTFVNKRSIVNQREVGSDTESMQIALKNALRQAPDVIQIGEIRDRETMTAALAYAQSGHLCLATLHANNAYRALNRILGFYPVELRPSLRGDLAASLRAVVAQRLLRTSDGSRVPALEVLLNTTLISDLIEKGELSSIKDAMEQSMTEGSQSFEQDIARLILDQRVARDEGLAHADSPTNLLWRLQNQGHLTTHTKDNAERHTAEEPIFTDITLDRQF